MLRRRLRAVGWTVGVMMLACAGVSPAHADKDEERWTKTAEPDGGSGGGGTPDGGGNPADPNCYFGGSVINCLGPNGGTWNGSCWETVWADSPDQAVWQPGRTDGAPGWNDANNRAGTAIDLWESQAPGGHTTTTGVIMQCLTPGGQYSYFYRESAAPPPSAAELEQTARLMLEGRITAPGIGVYPGWIDGTDPEAPGIIYWPTWLWADNPGEGIAAPATQTTTVNGYTLRAVARLDNIVYDTGDGKHVTCGLGAKPTGRNLTKPANPPPRCGHTYTDRGHYTITATTHVAVDWSGAGRAGTIPITVSRTGRYDVAEVQVLIVPGPHPTRR